MYTYTYSYLFLCIYLYIYIYICISGPPKLGVLWLFSRTQLLEPDAQFAHLQTPYILPIPKE